MYAERNIFEDIAGFANRFGEPLVNAFVSVVAGAVTAAITGNIIDAVKIAATGVGGLIVEIVKDGKNPNNNNAEKRAHRTPSLTRKITVSIMFVSLLITLILVVLVISATIWLLNPRVDAAIITSKLPNNAPRDEDFSDRSELKTKVLIVAINEWQDGDTLLGCDVDGERMMERVAKTLDFSDESIQSALKVYHDNPDGVMIRMVEEDAEIRVLRNSKATAENLKKGLAWLRANVREGDERLYYHAGHGTQTPSKEESDGLDECLVAYDHNWNKPQTWFIDDYVFDCVKDLPHDSSFLLVLDTCHSGNFLRSQNARERFISRFKPCPNALIGARAIKRAHFTEDYVNEESALLSGCRKDSVSYSVPVVINGVEVFAGALTNAFLSEHQKRPLASLQELYAPVYALLSSSERRQEPQLQGSRRIKNKPFLIGA